MGPMDLFYSAWTYFQQGGVVMLPMIVLSVAVWALIVERLLFFRSMEKIERGAGRICELDGCPLPPEIGRAHV